jgi:hypothetical protein
LVRGFIVGVADCGGTLSMRRCVCRTARERSIRPQSNVLRLEKKFDEALAAARRAIELNPRQASGMSAAASTGSAMGGYKA